MTLLVPYAGMVEAYRRSDRSVVALWQRFLNHCWLGIHISTTNVQTCFLKIAKPSRDMMISVQISKSSLYIGT